MNYRIRFVHNLLGSFLIFTVLVSCGLAPNQNVTSENSDFPFRAPTIQPPSPTPTSETQVVNSGISDSACTNDLTFVQDLTIPDGTIIAPGQEMEKQWLVENSGTCDWGEGYTIRLIAGSNFGAEDELSLFPALAGSQATISITFQAPSEPGNYGSSWQAYSPDGLPFGDNFFISIVVGE